MINEISVIKALIPCQGLHPPNLITFQRPNICILEEHKHTDHNKLQMTEKSTQTGLNKNGNVLAPMSKMPRMD